MDNILVLFVGRIYIDTVGIIMGTNYDPLLVGMMHYSEEAYFMQCLKGLLKKNEKASFYFPIR